MAEPYVSRSTFHWKDFHPEIQRARDLPGWKPFLQGCLQNGLGFEDIEALPGKGGFFAVTVRYERSDRGWVPYKVAEGRGKTVLDAMRAAFRLSVEAGFDIPTSIVQLLDAPAEKEPSPIAVGDVADLLGVTPASVEDLLG